MTCLQWQSATSLPGEPTGRHISCGSALVGRLTNPVSQAKRSRTAYGICKKIPGVCICVVRRLLDQISRSKVTPKRNFNPDNKTFDESVVEGLIYGGLQDAVTNWTDLVNDRSNSSSTGSEG